MRVIHRFSGHQCGFTLIEMSLVIVIGGILLASLLRLYPIWQAQSSVSRTIENLELGTSFIQGSYGRQGRYACPANPLLGPEDPGYGVESCRQPPAFACPAGLACEDGILIGAVPFRTLSDPATGVAVGELAGVQTLDAWDMKLTYAVTELMTDANQFGRANPASPQLGTIDVRDEFGNSIVDPAGSMHFVLLSHGQNRVGGFTANGLLIPGCAPLTLEAENCNRANNRFTHALQSRDRSAVMVFDPDLGAEISVTNRNYYDDYVLFGRSQMSQLWARIPGGPPGSTWLRNTNIGNVGVRTDQPSERLTVQGDLVAEGQIISTQDRFCPDNAVDDCLSVNFIAGSGFVCPNGQVATGISNNTLRCDDLIVALPVGLMCPDDLRLRGFDIDADGNMIHPDCESTP